MTSLYVIGLGFSGLAISFLATAVVQSLGLLVLIRLVGGGMQANLSVANAYVADITPPEERARRFGIGACLAARVSHAPDALSRYPASYSGALSLEFLDPDGNRLVAVQLLA